VLGLENERFLEGSAGPSIFLARQLRVPYPDMQLDCVGIERESLAKHGERLIVLPFVVQLMGALVVLFRTQERSGHVLQASGS